MAGSSLAIQYMTIQLRLLYLGSYRLQRRVLARQASPFTPAGHAPGMEAHATTRPTRKRQKSSHLKENPSDTFS